MAHPARPGQSAPARRARAPAKGSGASLTVSVVTPETVSRRGGLSLYFGRIATTGGRAKLDRRGVERAQPEVAPGHALADQRGHAQRQRGADLDRLQDDP